MDNVAHAAGWLSWLYGRLTRAGWRWNIGFSSGIYFHLPRDKKAIGTSAAIGFPIAITGTVGYLIS